MFILICEYKQKANIYFIYVVGLTNFEKSMKKNHFNYIICGGGASGLMLAYRLCNDKFFANKTILLIEKENKVSIMTIYRCCPLRGPSEFNDIYIIKVFRGTYSKNGLFPLF